MIITATRADTLVPGDRVDLKTVLGSFSTVETVRYIDVDAPGQKDLVEVTFTGSAISETRTYRVDRLVDVATA